MIGISVDRFDGCGYVELVRQVLHEGEPVASRHVGVRELLDVTVRLSCPEHAVPLKTTREVSLEIGAAKTVQLVGGVSNIQQLDAVSGGRFSRYTNDGVLRGACGPRTYLGVRRAVGMLRQDSSSRQAHVVAWRPGDANAGLRDIPGVVSFGFRVRHGRLAMVTHMRSSDVWLGVPYDFWRFTRLQIWVANELQLPVGEYVYHSDSLHLYEADVDTARALECAPDGRRQPPAPVHLPGCTSRRDAQVVALGQPLSCWCPGLRYYSELLESKTEPATHCRHCRYTKPDCACL